MYDEEVAYFTLLRLPEFAGRQRHSNRPGFGIPDCLAWCSRVAIFGSLSVQVGAVISVTHDGRPNRVVTRLYEICPVNTGKIRFSSRTRCGPSRLDCGKFGL